jgi:hypothetical protein
MDILLNSVDMPKGHSAQPVVLEESILLEMKARKIAGIRLINYINDGITWKSHKDVILDFWIMKKCQESGYTPYQFRNMFRVVQLPTEAQQKYQKWFESYDFQNDTDKDWLEFVNGTLNLFYRTDSPKAEDDECWYIDMMQSEVEARQIVSEQVYHGAPNLDAFWKISTDSKPEEVGGRRNGYMYVSKLGEVTPKDTDGYFWGVVFQCPETVSLGFDDNGVNRRKCIAWAANAEHMTLVRIGADGRFSIEPVDVEGKAWKADRTIPSGNVNRNPMSARALLSYITDNFASLYGVWDTIDEKVKGIREQSTARLTALNTLNDEEIKVGKVIGDIEKFVREGNVSDKRREYNKEIRQAVIKKLRIRDKESHRVANDIAKAEKRKELRERAKYNPTLKPN